MRVDEARFSASGAGSTNGDPSALGSVVFSLDAELAWGFPDFDDPPMDRIDGARDAWTWLLALFDEYDVPATWAVVGHLFLSDCDGRHADLGAPQGWFDFETNAFAARRDVRFASDLVDAIADANAPHDIGSHSFGHVVFDDSRVTRETVERDLDRAVEVADERGLDLDSFVFPRNAVAHRDVLAERGFRTYRSVAPEPDSDWRKALGKLATVADPDRVPLVTPRVDEYGLVDVPPSLFLFGFEGRPRDVLATVWEDPIVRQAQHAIDRAAVEGGTCHFWLHPNNVVDDADRERLRAIVAHTAHRCDQGDVLVETMSDVADRVAPKPEPSVLH